MKNEKIVKRLDKSIANHTICQMWQTFDEEREYQMLPICRSDELVVFVPDGDAEKNGYVVRRMSDITKIKKTDNVVGGHKLETIKASHVAEIDLTDIRSALASLGQGGHIVVVECEGISEKTKKYAIGKIDKVGKNNLGIRYFGPDKNMEDCKWKIPYEQITRITIGSGYTKVLNNYVTDTSCAELVDEVEDLPGQTLVQPE